MTTDLNMYQGDDYSGVVSVTQAGQPVDLTGYTALAHIRCGYADDYPAILATLQTTVAGSDVVLALHRDETTKLAGTYRWDLQLTAADGTRHTVTAGAVYVEPEVTRDV